MRIQSKGTVTIQTVECRFTARDVERALVLLLTEKNAVSDDLLKNAKLESDAEPVEMVLRIPVEEQKENNYGGITTIRDEHPSLDWDL